MKTHIMYLFLLQGFQHPALGSQRNIWALDSVPSLRQFTFAAEDADRINLVHTIIDAFEREVVPLIDSLEKGKCEFYAVVRLFIIYYPIVFINPLIPNDL
jgi:hypothetical protein